MLENFDEAPNSSGSDAPDTPRSPAHGSDSPGSPASLRYRSAYEKNFSQILSNDVLYGEPLPTSVTSYSKEMTSNSSLDFGEWMAGRDSWRKITNRSVSSRVPKKIILSDPRCLHIVCQLNYMLELWFIDSLSSAGFSVLGMTQAGTLTPIPMPQSIEPKKRYDDPYDEESDTAQYLSELLALNLQCGTQEQMAQQLSSQGLDPGQYCILDMSLFEKLLSRFKSREKQTYASKKFPDDKLPEAAEILAQFSGTKKYISDMNYCEGRDINRIKLLFSWLKQLPDLESLSIALPKNFKAEAALWHGWPKLKNLTTTMDSLELDLTPLHNLEDYTLIVDSLRNTPEDFFITTLPKVPNTLKKFSIVGKSGPRNRFFSQKFLEACSSCFPTLTQLETLELDYIPIPNLNILPKTLRRLCFHCGLFPQPIELNFSEFPNLEELTIVYNPGSPAPKIIGVDIKVKLQVVDELEKWHISVFGKAEKQTIEQENTEHTEQCVEIEEAWINTDTYTPPGQTFNANYSIKEFKDGQPVIFPYRDIREKVESFCKVVPPQNSHLFTCEKLGIQKASLHKLHKGAMLEPGEAVCELMIPPGTTSVILPRRSIDDCINRIVMPNGGDILYDLESDYYELTLPASKTPTLLQYNLMRSDKGPHRHPRTYRPTPLLAREKRELLAECPGINTSNIMTIFSCFCPDESLPKDKRAKTVADVFLTFDNKPLPPGQKHTWRDVWKHKTGSCDHRARLFARFARAYGLIVRLRGAPGHIRPEVLHPVTGMWTAVELGGHPAKVLPPEIINATPWETYFLKSAALPPSFTHVTSVYDYLSSRTGLRMEVHSAEQARGIYVGLQQHLQGGLTASSPSCVIYVESRRDLDEAWEQLRVGSDGKLTKVPGPLQIALRDTTSSPLLMVNWQGFTDQEIASYKSLLDTPPTLFGQDTSRVKVLSFTNPKNSCGAFYSRTQEMCWPKNIALPAPVHITLSIAAPTITSASSTSASVAMDTSDSERKRQAKRPRDESEEEDVPSLHASTPAFFSPASLRPQVTPSLSIDLYGDKNWRKRLLGEFRPTAGGAAFVPGALIKQIKDCKGVVQLIDPPLYDSEFQAFIARAEREKCIWANGQPFPLPADFRWNFRKDPLVSPPNIKPTAIHSLADAATEDDPFYLHTDNFATLFNQYQITKKDEIIETTGWLAQSTGRPKRLIQTGELTPGQLRELKHALAGKPINWTCLTAQPTSSPKRAKSEEKRESKETLRGIPPPDRPLVICDDPHFLAKQWSAQFDLSCAINLTTSSSDLLELIELPLRKDKEEKETGISLTCKYQLQAVAKALLDGKNVLLHGQLSPAVYRALETALAPKPTLQLAKAFPAKPLGRLVFAVEPINFATPLVDFGLGSRTISNETLWHAYERRLKKVLGPKFNKTHWQNLKLLHELAAQLPDAGKKMRMSYSRLRTALYSLQPRSKIKDPVKALFLHHYDHQQDGETYAYLNVIAKYLFTPREGQPKRRVDKLTKYPSSSATPWQRLNCLNADALDQVFGKNIRTFSKKTPPTWKEDAGWESIPPNLNPISKLITRMENCLNQERMLVLKGPPGTGKSYAAIQYAKKHKAKLFNALDPAQILQFLNYKGPKRAILMVDEANLKQNGTWEFLRPLTQALEMGAMTVTYQGQSFALSDHHRVIFTCNPESFMGRETHELLQDVHTFYVNHWTDHDLEYKIMQPLAKRMKNGAPLHTAEEAALKWLLHAFNWMKKNLPPNQISLRDLDALILRWSSYMQDADPKLALHLAVAACKQEWQHRFPQGVQTQKFLRFLHELEFSAMEIDAEKISFPSGPPDFKSRTSFKARTDFLATSRSCGYTLSDSASSLYAKKAELKAASFLSDSSSARSYKPSQRQQQILNLVLEDLDLALNTNHWISDDGVPVAKQGVLLEGDSGFGKSELLKQALLQRGYVQGDAEALLKAPFSKVNPKRFIQFTASGDTQRDCELLENAFDKGWAVIFDELNLNSDPRIEALLNQLCTGKKPTDNLRTPAKRTPGFFLLASQNNGAHKGRKSISAALLNRLHPIFVQEHNQEELLAYISNDAILCKLPKNTQSGLVQGFVIARETKHAEINDRNFFQLANALRKYIGEIPDFCSLGADEQNTVIESWLAPPYMPASHAALSSSSSSSSASSQGGISSSAFFHMRADPDQLRQPESAMLDLSPKSDRAALIR